MPEGERVAFDGQGGSLKIDGLRVRGGVRAFKLRGTKLTASNVDVERPPTRQQRRAAARRRAKEARDG